MKRKDFGQLIKALRKEKRHNQYEMANYCWISEAMASRLEQGKARIDDIMLSNLASYFQLTTGERREFFSAAVDFPSGELSLVSASELKPKLRSVASRSELPCFVANQYGDVLYINDMLFMLLELNDELVEEAANLNMYNLIYMVLHEHYRELMGASSRKQLVDNFVQFREITLQYRATDRFRNIKNTLQKRFDGQFDTYWDITRIDKERARDSVSFDYKYTHRTYGALNYVGSIMPHNVKEGVLYVHNYVPLNKNTRVQFQKIAESTNRAVIELTLWP